MEILKRIYIFNYFLIIDSWIGCIQRNSQKLRAINPMQCQQKPYNLQIKIVLRIKLLIQTYLILFHLRVKNVSHQLKIFYYFKINSII